MKKMKNRQKEGAIRSGVFTVEASVIVPMAVMMTALIVILIFYVHNRCWYTCAAYECAIVGNGANILSESEGTQRASSQAAGRIRDQVMPGSIPKTRIHSSGSGTSVAFSGQTYPMFNRELKPFQAEAEVVRVVPESYLRARWAASAVRDRIRE